MDINQTRYNAEVANCAAWGIEKLREKIGETSRLLTARCQELKARGSWDDVLVFQGDAASKRQQMSDMNTDLAAWNDAYEIRQRDLTWADNIELATGVRPAEDSPARVDAPTYHTLDQQPVRDITQSPYGRAIRNHFNPAMQAGNLEAIVGINGGCVGEFAEDGYGTSLTNALFSTSSWTPESVRSGRFELLPRHMPIFPRVLPVINVNQANYVWVEETTATGGATRAEGAAANEATIAAGVKTVAMRSVAVTIGMTEESMDDVPAARGHVTRRLPMLMEDVIDGQCLNGSGTGTNFDGFLSYTGTNELTLAANALSAPTQAKNFDMLVSFHKMIVDQVVAGGTSAQPDLTFFNPSLYHQLRCMVDENGRFYFGDPTASGMARLYGVPFSFHTRLPDSANDAVVGLMGAFRAHTAYLSRKGLSFAMTDTHGTEFVEFKLRFRLDTRGNVACFQKKALTKIKANSTY